VGANAFHVCYGLRWDIVTAGENEVSLLERREDPRQVAARQHRLDSWWGMTTDEERYFLIIGRLVGHFGWEGEHDARLDGTEVPRLMEETRQRLRAAGFTHEPAWHFQFEPDR